LLPYAALGWHLKREAQDAIDTFFARECRSLQADRDTRGRENDSVIVMRMANARLSIASARPRTSLDGIVRRVVVGGRSRLDRRQYRSQTVTFPCRARNEQGIAGNRASRGIGAATAMLGARRGMRYA